MTKEYARWIIKYHAETALATFNAWKEIGIVLDTVALAEATILNLK